ncbi:hypothetical protein [Coleofasciculus sp. FACHB-129]|uniref:hypothetical protein n=1 Tax=Cyanophyceae TaxID=3028117 RepID=UPI0016859998|nr:hypothetical protein [Coleofasciculus sp. FACHB-129]MBD1893119.1 hypothetical protein [Coleofasciculus sp. FACHB-129]
MLAVELNNINAGNRSRRGSSKAAEEESPAIDVPVRTVEQLSLPATEQNIQLPNSMLLAKTESDRPQVPIGTCTSNLPRSTKQLDNLIRQTVLIWGNQDSGKSSVARYIAKLKTEQRYRGRGSRHK